MNNEENRFLASMKANLPFGIVIIIVATLIGIFS